MRNTPIAALRYRKDAVQIRPAGGDAERAQVLQEQSLDLYQELRDMAGRAYALTNSATALYEGALALQRELGNERGAARALARLSTSRQAKLDDPDLTWPTFPYVPVARDCPPPGGRTTVTRTFSQTQTTKKGSRLEPTPF